MGMADLAKKWEEYTRLSAEIALEVRNCLRPESYVAGSIAPALKGETPGEVEGQVMALAEFGVDIILLEYFSRLDSCINGIKESSECGRPVFLGTKHVRTDGTLYTEESAETLAISLEDLKVDAILAMYSKPKGISAFLPNLRQDFHGTVGAYANISYRRNGDKPDYPNRQWHVIENKQYPPNRYSEFSEQWLEMGAQIIGGCCATTPEHIKAMQPLVQA